MSDENTRDGRRRRAELRAAALRLGGLLGWSSREAITFAETVTNRPWRRCGCADFETVLEEYWAIGRVIHSSSTSGPATCAKKGSLLRMSAFIALPKNRHPAVSYSGREKRGGLVLPVLGDSESSRDVIVHPLSS
jgi:hypothetical protein